MAKLQSGTIVYGNLTVNTFANINGNLILGSLIYAGGSPGTNGQVLQNIGGTGVGWANPSAGTQIQSGTSNIAILSSGSNVVISVGGSIIANVGTTGLTVIGGISAGTFTGNGAALTGLPAGYSNVNAATYLVSGTLATAINTTSNILAAGIIGNTITAGMLTANAVTTVLTHGSDPSFQLTAQNGYLNSTGSEVARFGINYSGTGWDSFTQYVRGSTAQNGYQSLWAANAPIANITSTGLTVTGIVNASGNILSTGAVHNALTVNGTTTQAGTLTVSSGFINSSGNVVAATVVGSNVFVNGNVTAAYVIGNGSQLTGLPAGYSNVNLLSYLVSGIAGTIIPSANLTYNIGSLTAQWNTIYGAAVTAKYADLAENYTSDQQYPPGTVVIFGGDQEVTISTVSHDPRIAGIVSTEPAYLMNSATTGVPVALQGRVPCQVLGPVEKGDRLVASQHPGIAQKLNPGLYEPGCIIGKALEPIVESSVKTIEVVVGRV